MRNIAFSIWMVGFPISDSASAYFYQKAGIIAIKTNELGDVTSGILSLATWIIVGYLLYERKPKN